MTSSRCFTCRIYFVNKCFCFFEDCKKNRHFFLRFCYHGFKIRHIYRLKIEMFTCLRLLKLSFKSYSGRRFVGQVGQMISAPLFSKQKTISNNYFCTMDIQHTRTYFVQFFLYMFCSEYNRLVHIQLTTDYFL